MLSFVLALRDYKEVDRIVTLYTAERGKVDVLARGIKKSVAKNAAALEGPALLEVEVTSGKEFPVLTTATVVEPFFGVRKSYPALAGLSVLFKIVNELTATGQPDEKLFTTLYKAIVWFAGSVALDSVQVDMSVLEILKAMGFKPEIEHCVVCGDGLNAKNNSGFSIESGGAVCGKHKEVAMVPLTEQVRQIFLANNSKKNSVTLSQKEAASFHNIVYKFLLYHTGKYIADWQKIPLI